MHRITQRKVLRNNSVGTEIYIVRIDSSKTGRNTRRGFTFASLKKRYFSRRGNTTALNIGAQKGRRVHFANALFSQAERESLRGLHRRIIAYGPPRKNEMFTLKISAPPLMLCVCTCCICVPDVHMYCTTAELASAARAVSRTEKIVGS
ncbi:hypothetical protein PUN28_013137 [Cardiocondyla obscurior]|uniref:Uncharacterized protein n=1 Tax=Cardiocondyla obscurior TaxID=286306 RepID=A0AAW2FB51_9HYME